LDLFCNLAAIRRSAVRSDVLLGGMKACTVYIRGNDIYLVSMGKNVFGIFHDIEPFFKISIPVSSRQLGERILQVLDSCRENVPAKTYVRGVKRPPSPFLAFAGFRSWKAFEKGAQHFLISSDDSEIEVTPGAPRQQGGYAHQPHRAVRCPAQADQIGSLLLEQIPKP
jgi:hypothetical protein